MIRLFLITFILFILAVLIWELKKYFTRDKKENELQEIILEGDVIDIEREIAEEKERQKSVVTDTQELNSNNKTEK
jgi:hypothetical protein